MILTPVVVSTIITPPSPCFYAEHAGGTVTRTGQGLLATAKGLVCADTKAALDSELVRLGIAPLPLTPRQKAAALFATFPGPVQQGFASVFQALNALQSTAEVIRGVTAVTVTEDIAPYKQQLLATLNGD